jgi:hypothetical protein
VLNRLTRRYGWRPTSDLIGVQYEIDVPPDTEFPKSMSPFDVFFRLFVEHGNSIRLRLQITWLDSRPNIPGAVQVSQSTRFALTPNTAQDCVIRLHTLVFPGEGRYVIELQARRRATEFPRWRTLSREFFFVMR